MNVHEIEHRRPPESVPNLGVRKDCDAAFREEVTQHLASFRGPLRPSAGRIAEIRVEEGQSVEEGDILVVIE